MIVDNFTIILYIINATLHDHELFVYCGGKNINQIRGL